MKRILIMGLPGTGKTTLATELQTRLNSAHFNADKVRALFNDWDFSEEGRIRQSQRMRDLADASAVDYVIADFIAPLKQMRDIYAADYVIWMDTEKTSDYEDTNKMFERPRYVNFIVTTKDAQFLSDMIIKDFERNL